MPQRGLCDRLWAGSSMFLPGRSATSCVVFAHLQYYSRYSIVFTCSMVQWELRHRGTRESGRSVAGHRAHRDSSQAGVGTSSMSKFEGGAHESIEYTSCLLWSRIAWVCSKRVSTTLSCVTIQSSCAHSLSATTSASRLRGDWSRTPHSASTSCARLKMLVLLACTITGFSALMTGRWQRFPGKHSTMTWNVP